MSIHSCKPLVALLVALAANAANAAPMHKCVINGSVSFQQAPCPPDQARKQPTVEELNAERKKKAATAQGEPAPTRAASTAATAPAMAKTLAPPERFRCDGRQHCSQMRSCEEARYFLARCPDVKMDGDRDGIPCEEQWCSAER
jgi:hypothetical protein